MTGTSRAGPPLRVMGTEEVLASSGDSNPSKGGIGRSDVEGGVSTSGGGAWSSGVSGWPEVAAAVVAIIWLTRQLRLVEFEKPLKSVYILLHVLYEYEVRLIERFHEKTVKTDLDLSGECNQPHLHNPFGSIQTPLKSPSVVREGTNLGGHTRTPRQHILYISYCAVPMDPDPSPWAAHEHRQTILTLLMAGTLSVALECESQSASIE